MASIHSARTKRHYRVRNKVSGSSERPRLNIFRSTSHIYAQVIDDTKGATLAAASTLSPELKDLKVLGGNITAAVRVGKLIAEKCLAAGIKLVVFDRGGYLYHGRIKALADGAREGGLEF